MSHDATKVVMGSPGMSDYNATDFTGDPATYLAGLACRLKSDGTVSIIKADGSWIGVSLGKSLSDTKRLSILTDGCRVPLLLEAKPATGSIEISSYANLVSGTPDSVGVGATTFTAQSTAVTPGQATFRAATSNDATAISLAAQINAHATAGALVYAEAGTGDDIGYVFITAKSNTSAGNSIALAYTNNDGNTGVNLQEETLLGGGDAPDFVTLGTKVYISDSTGKGDSSESDSTISDAIYASGVLTGIDESGAEVYAAYIDMPGGL